MAHHSRVRTSGNSWLNILPSEIAALDGGIVSCLNVVDGGTYAPATQIVLGGSGLQLTGPLTVARGGTLVSNNGVLSFDPGNFPSLGPTHSGRTRKFVHSFVEARPIPYAMWRVRRDSSAMQSVAPSYVDWQTGQTLPARLSLRIRGMMYATISSITVTFSIVTPHTALPTIMPSFRLLQVDVNGNATLCTSQAAGADADGWNYVPTPISPAAWTAAQLTQSFTFPCDQNNLVLRNEYTYQLEVRDEQGLSGFPWVVPLLQPCRALQYETTLPLAGLAAIDGYTPIGDGTERILVLNTPFDQGNCETGIYIAAAGDWVRASDLAANFGQGAIVGIQQGNSYAGAIFQASPTVSSWSPGTTPPCGAWQGSWTPALRTPVLPVASTSGYWYLCTTSGTTGPNEPSWPTSIGQTIVDGGAVWTCMGPAAGPLPFVTRPDADVWLPGLGLCMNSNGTVYHAAQVTYSQINSNRWQ